MSNNRTILSRPRTKIYDSNYNIGESYYKSTLDRLDRKYSGRPLSPSRYTTSAADIAERHARAFAEEDIEDARRRRASSRIRDTNTFDSRGTRFRLGSEDDDIMSDETASTLKRIRAAKKVSYVDDVDMESTTNNIRSHRLLDRSEKILDSIGLNDTKAEMSYVNKRALKVATDGGGDNLTKWSSIKENGETTGSSTTTSGGAAARARQSRARIEDIDEEMAAMHEKQALRERRVARLKQLVAECDAETVDDSGVAITDKKVRF